MAKLRVVRVLIHVDPEKQRDGGERVDVYDVENGAKDGSLSDSPDELGARGLSSIDRHGV